MTNFLRMINKSEQDKQLRSTQNTADEVREYTASLLEQFKIIDETDGQMLQNRGSKKPSSIFGSRRFTVPESQGVSLRGGSLNPI